MNILVTGATGLLGYALLRRLSQQNELTLFGVSRTKNIELPGVQYVYGDIAEPDTYSELPASMDACIHTAAGIFASGLDDLSGLMNTNLNGTTALCSWLEQNGAPHVVFSSTISVYKPGLPDATNENSELLPDNPYGYSKLFGEMIVGMSELDQTILRFSALFDGEGRAQATQPLLYDWMRKAARGEELVVFGDGEARRQYLHVEDAVDALVEVLNQRVTGVFNVGPTQQPTMLELAQDIVAAAGGKGTVRTDAGKNIKAPIRNLDVSKIRDVLGFNPKRELNAAVVEFLSREELA